ncbi:MAG: HAMP domain-containing sensor histidine kinase [bacterium]
MRREIKLIIWVFVLVVGPALTLSFLAARVLESWQIVLQKRMAGEAGHVLEGAVATWEHELAALRLAPESPAGQSKPASRWLVHAAGLSLRHQWVEGVYVYQPGSGLLYPPVESVVSRFEPTAPNGEMELLLNEGGTHLERGETNAAIDCFEGVVSGFDRAKPSISRDPDEGFFYDLVALRRLVELYEGEGQAARAAVIRARLLERVLNRYDELVPLQRESLIEWISGEMAKGQWLMGNGQEPALSTALGAQWRERMRGRQLGEAERAEWVGGFRMMESTIPDAGWSTLRMRQANVLITKITQPGAPAIFLALEFNENRLTEHLNILFALSADKTELRVQCRTQKNEPDGPILASRQLPPPFEAMAVIATPENVQAFVANARLQTWLYRGGGVLLLMSVVAGVWLVWREAAREIQQARERSDFAATVSHDLRTPLSSMRMLAESMYMGNVTDEGKRKKFLGAIIKESDRLSRLTDRALYFIRYGQGALRYQFTEGDLASVVREVVEAFAVGVGGKVKVIGSEALAGAGENERIVIGINMAQELPPVRFDVGAMEQVVYNLLDNAVKYSFKDKAVLIEVRLMAQAGAMVLTVQDHGVGMTPDELRHIMKPYVRGKTAGRQNARGLGLGLALCQHVVQAHGGRIQIQSEAGNGSIFCIILPG